jgi:membrane protein
VVRGPLLRRAPERCDTRSVSSVRSEEGDAPSAQASRRFGAARARFEGSWAQDLTTRLKVADFGNSIVLFGAALLISVLPLLLLMSALADTRIDDDLSRHIGLDRAGAHIIEGLFRKKPTHSAGPIVLGLIVAFAATMTLVSSLQMIYERVFDQQHRGWRDFPRFVVWVCALVGLAIGAAAYDYPLRRDAGPVVRGLVSFVLITGFLWWTMHLLLAGRLTWRQLIRPAIVTSVMWFGLALFSSVYFSSAVTSENKLFGTIGVVFILLTWFIAVGAVVVLGAAGGAVWQERKERTAGRGPERGLGQIDEGSAGDRVLR